MLAAERHLSSAFSLSVVAVLLTLTSTKRTSGPTSWACSYSNARASVRQLWHGRSPPIR